MLSEVAGDGDAAGADPVDDRPAEHLQQHQRHQLGAARPGRSAWALPVVVSTNHGIAIIETRVPVSEIASAVSQP